MNPTGERAFLSPGLSWGIVGLGIELPSANMDPGIRGPIGPWEWTCCCVKERNIYGQVVPSDECARRAV